MSMSASERAERIRAVRGYIGTDGIVICGSCMDEHRYRAAGSVAESATFAEAAYEPYNPTEGDDWCSVCDRDITGTWRHL
jgi:hypothetical protein